MEEQINQHEAPTTITSKEFAAKASSKREIYQLLCQEARAYLPQPALISIYFLKDLIAGTRKFVKNENVKHYHVPYYDSLSIKEMINFGAFNYPELAIYFPELKEQGKLPRTWIINVLYSTIGEEFTVFVKSRTDARNQKIFVQKDLSVAIDADVLAAFQSSGLVSIGKSAKGASLLKIGSKRKRTKREIDEEKAIKLSQEQEIAEKLQNFHQMEQQMNQMQADLQANQVNTNLINNLVSQGVASFDENGDLSIHHQGQSSLVEEQND